MTDKNYLDRMILPTQLSEILTDKRTIIPENRQHILELALKDKDTDFFEVAYEIEGKGRVVEATVTRCKNGASVNFTDIYMRRRDPDCMVIADEKETDKIRYFDRYEGDFKSLRQATFDWFEQQEKLIVLPFYSGGEQFGYPSLLVSPANAGFFVGGLADLQGFVPKNEIPEGFKPKSIIYLAPPFRHTHFDGKQVVIHNRFDGMHEIFSYNLYPGPSAKKGVYGILLNIGEEEGWVTLHASSVKIITPYENEFVIMHEGASGGGKSEMIQKLHREPDGKIKLCTNTENGEQIFMDLADECELQPITDDMALCPPEIQKKGRKLLATDAEAGWFLRVDHLKEYGTEPFLEKLTIHPPEPLIFLNLDGKANSTCLLWEHKMDDPETPCPNPRVIMPRRFVPDTVNEPVEIDVRTFGVRTPPSTRKNPNYGIMGMLHIIPLAVAWLWRLVAPRGHANPSIVGISGLTSEGVGSYWPFATGKMVTQANLLLKQMIDTPHTRYKIIPNQYIGAYHVGFMPEWLSREYLSRRGSVNFKSHQLEKSRCALLGYTLKSLRIDGNYIPKWLLTVEEQLEVGIEGYDAGAKIIKDFFKKELEKFYTSELDEKGKKIIDICMSDGDLQDYINILPQPDHHFF